MERHYDSINFTKEDKNNLDFCKITRVDKRKSEVKEYFKPYKLMFLFLSLVFYFNWCIVHYKGKENN